MAGSRSSRALVLAASLAAGAFSHGGEFQEKKIEGGSYVLVLPDGWKAGGKYPVHVALHGRGDNPNNFSRWWAPFTKPKGIVLAAPKCANANGWQDEDIEIVRAVIKDVAEKHGGDPARVLVSGFSAGGNGAFLFLDKHPAECRMFAGMGTDMAASLDSLKAAAAQGVRVYYAVGKRDKWHEYYAQGVEALKESGVACRTEEPDVGHTLTAEQGRTITDMFLAALAAPAPAKKDAPDAPAAAAGRFREEKTETGKYLLALPDGWKKDARYPVHIVLHGSMESCRFMADWWGRMQKGKGIVTACPEGEDPLSWGNTDMPHVRAVLLDVIEKHGGDADRVLISGFSSGCAAAFMFMDEHPKDCLVYAGVCHDLLVSAESLKEAAENGARVYYSVGKRDKAVYAGYRDAVAKLKESGIEHKAEDPDLDHVMAPEQGHAILAVFQAACEAGGAEKELLAARELEDKGDAAGAKAKYEAVARKHEKDKIGAKAREALERLAAARKDPGAAKNPAEPGLYIGPKQ